MIQRITCLLSILLYMTAGAYAQCNLSVQATASGALFCPGDSLVLNAVTADTGVSFAWSGPNGYIDSNQSDTVYPVITTSTGYYKVVMYRTGCASDSDSVNVVIKPGPDTPSTSSNAPICKGDTLRMYSTGTSNIGYHWTGPLSQSYSLKDPIIYGYHVVGKQQFVLRTDSNGCFSAPDTLTLVVKPTDPPSVSISSDVGFIVKPNTVVTLTANVTNEAENTRYQWRLNGVDQPADTNKTYQVVAGVDVKQNDLISVWILTQPNCASSNTATSNDASIYIDLGVTDVSAAGNRLQLSPNPAKGIIHINGLEKGTEVNVFDMTGKHVRSVLTKDSCLDMDISNMKNGMYIIKSGNKVARLVKTN